MATRCEAAKSNRARPRCLCPTGARISCSKCHGSTTDYDLISCFNIDASAHAHERHTSEK
eukprot:15383561-Alexandrium_andersonii.AAC.1